MSRKLLLLVVALLFLSCALPAHADSFAANNAGPLPSSAQDLTGLNVTEITGTVDFPLGVDMFKIDITDFTDFSAMTVGPPAFGIPDTALFLFDASGMGVLANDDISGANTLSCLPSAGSGNPCPTALPAGTGPTSDGTYFLAITRSANFPLDGSANEIFTNSASTDVVGPNSGTGPIAGWDGNVFTGPDFDLINFDILLTGTSPVATPEPATWTLLASGLVFILLRRKKFASA
jgi:PEP-CTERM motif